MKKTLAVVVTTAGLLLSPAVAAHAQESSSPATTQVDNDTDDGNESDKTGLLGLLGLVGLAGLMKKRHDDHSHDNNNANVGARKNANH